MAFILATDFDFIAYMSKMAFFWKLFSRQWRFWNMMILYTTDLLVHKVSEDCRHSKTNVSVHTSTLSTCARVHLPFPPVPRLGDHTCLLHFLLLLLLVSTMATRTKLQTFLMHRVLLPRGSLAAVCGVCEAGRVGSPRGAGVPVRSDGCGGGRGCCCCGCGGGGSFLPPGVLGGRFCVPWAPFWFGPRCDPSAFGESELREKEERKSVVDQDRCSSQQTRRNADMWSNTDTVEQTNTYTHTQTHGHT